MKTIITYLIVLALPFKLFAQPGTLDKSFGENGQAITRFGNASVIVYKGLIQPDNKIIAVGEYESSLPPYNGFIAIRYMPDGLIDSSFGDSGKTIITDPSQNLIPSSACLQNDGKILIAGHGVVGLFPPVYTGVIIRLNTDGSLDSSFGEKGFVYTSEDPNSTAYSAIALQPDGRIVGVGATSNSQFVNRLAENGLPDLSFGTNGFVFFGSRYYYLFACQIQQDGKIIIGGGYRGVLVPEKFLLKRFQTNGEPDLSFDSAGTAVTQIGNYDSYIYDLALQLDGKIVALGPTDNYTASVSARYNVDGNLDNTYANDGIAHNYFPGIFGRAQSLFIQDDNKILLGGGAYIDEKSDYGLERLTANGLIDSSFGVNGEVTTNFVDYSGNGIASIGLQTLGKIVAIGGSSNIGDYNVSLARYNNDLTQKQITVTKIKKWLQHHNGFTWDANSTISSYIIQRSNDSAHFSSIARINACNTSNYTYNDPSPLNGNNYYRVQTTSESGAVTNSNVIAVRSNNNAIKISPNPATNSLHIEGLSLNQHIKLTVVDFPGNVAVSKQLTANSSSSYYLNIALLKAGNHLLKIETNDDIVTKKFMKE